MKHRTLMSISALFLLSLTTPRLATAQAASGTYRFFLDDDVLKYVEFDARTDERGVTTGQISFIDRARISDVDDPEDPRSGDTPPEFHMTAVVDGMRVEENRAVMSATVTDSTHRSYIGRWVQLVVEDNGDNPRVPDKLTWSFCKPRPGGWVPSDSERRDDDGAYLRWWATDAERDDDVGIPSVNLISSEERGCTIYSLSFYSFVDVTQGEGSIIVQRR
ncbi:MAG TPA: hypothetical protein VKK31_15590 [Thermoanaerobaculia bacterium]|nr:hypothetical protein [Thermoanaerobaculia bacterium]